MWVDYLRILQTPNVQESKMLLIKCSVKPTIRLVYRHRRSISPDPSDVIFCPEVMIKKLEDIPSFIFEKGQEGRARFQILCFTQKMQSRP